MGLGKKYRGALPDVLKKYTDDVLSGEKEKYITKRAFVTSTCTEPALPEEIKRYVESKHIFDEVIITTAVSYTHLDVYKRQGYHVPAQSIRQSAAPNSFFRLSTVQQTRTQEGRQDKFSGQHHNN